MKGLIMNTGSTINFVGNNKKIYNTIKGRIFNKPQNLGEGLQRVVNYASKKQNCSPYSACLLNIQTIGNDINAIQTRSYTNGVTFYQNKKGLFVIGPSDFSLMSNNLKKILACSQPVAATLRKTNNLYNTVIKFTNNLNNIKECLFIKDYDGRITKVKSSITKTASDYNGIAGELSINQNSMLKQFTTKQ